MLPVLLLTVGALVTGYSLWLLRRWLQQASVGLNEGPRRLEVLAEELINSAEAASAAVVEETERLDELIGRAERRAAELRELLERPAERGQAQGPRGGRVTVSAVPLRFRHARKEIRRTASERAALSQPGPAMINPMPATGSGFAAPNRTLASEAAAPDLRVSAASAAAPPPPVGTASETPETHRLVYTLADKGSDVTQIARQLSITKGEVQLILGLRRLN